MWRARMTMLCVTMLATGLAAYGAEANPEVQLQRALDQPLTLSLDNVPLSEAFKQIAAAAKIALEVDAACYDALPYGPTVKVTADFRQSKVRDALEEVLVPLGLQQAVSGGTVMIRPSAPLARIGRRAEWDELKLLKDLRTSLDIRLPAKGAFDLTAAIRSVMDTRPGLIVAIANGTGPAHDAAIDQIQKQLPMSAFRALETYCQLTHQIWFVEGGPEAGGETGGKICIMPEKQWIQKQLQRPIELSHSNAPLKDVVADLTAKSGIRFVPEPGLYQDVPRVSLSSHNGSVQQALEVLAGATRIEFDVRDDSILLHLAAAPGNVAPQRADTIIGRISVPLGADGFTMDMYIRESDLPPELRDLWKKKMADATDAMKRALAAPPAVAATGPATRPTTQPAAGDK